MANDLNEAISALCEQCHAIIEQREAAILSPPKPTVYALSDYLAKLHLNIAILGERLETLQSEYSKARADES